MTLIQGSLTVTFRLFLLSTVLLEEQSFLVNLGPNYQFDVLLRVLLFQVKKQEIYREVN